MFGSTWGGVAASWCSTPTARGSGMRTQRTATSSSFGSSRSRGSKEPTPAPPEDGLRTPRATSSNFSSSSRSRKSRELALASPEEGEQAATEENQMGLRNPRAPRATSLSSRSKGSKELTLAEGQQGHCAAPRTRADIDRDFAALLSGPDCPCQDQRRTSKEGRDSQRSSTLPEKRSSSKTATFPTRPGTMGSLGEAANEDPSKTPKAEKGSRRGSRGSREGGVVEKRKSDEGLVAHMVDQGLSLEEMLQALDDGPPEPIGGPTQAIVTQHEDVGLVKQTEHEDVSVEEMLRQLEEGKRERNRKRSQAKRDGRYADFDDGALADPTARASSTEKVLDKGIDNVYTRLEQIRRRSKDLYDP